MDDEDLMVGGEDLDYEEYDLDEEEEKALLEEDGLEEEVRFLILTKIFKTQLRLSSSLLLC